MGPDQATAGNERESASTNNTPLSKYLALLLFIVLPFIGGWIGYYYALMKVAGVEKVEPMVTFGSDQTVDLGVKNADGLFANQEFDYVASKYIRTRDYQISPRKDEGKEPVRLYSLETKDVGISFDYPIGTTPDEHYNGSTIQIFIKTSFERALTDEEREGVDESGLYRGGTLIELDIFNYVEKGNYCPKGWCQLEIIETVPTANHVVNYHGTSSPYCDVGYCDSEGYIYSFKAADWQVYIETRLPYHVSSKSEVFEYIDEEFIGYRKGETRERNGETYYIGGIDLYATIGHIIENLKVQVR